MIPELTLRTSGGSRYKYPVIEGSYRDLLQLTQPQKPLTIDWAEEPYLDTPDDKPEPQDKRPLKIKIASKQTISLNTLKTVESMAIGTRKALEVRIVSVDEEHFHSAHLYTLRGDIKQSKPPKVTMLPPCKEIPSSRFYYLSHQRVSLADIGAIPLDGWRKALQYTTRYKETRQLASREVTLPILLQGDSITQLLNSRDTLDSLLYRRVRNKLETPQGETTFSFTRSRLKEYSLSELSPYILLDLTITLV